MPDYEKDNVVKFVYCLVFLTTCSQRLINIIQISIWFLFGFYTYHHQNMLNSIRTILYSSTDVSEHCQRELRNCPARFYPSPRLSRSLRPLRPEAGIWDNIPL